MRNSEQNFEDRMAMARIDREARASKAKKERRQRKASVITLVIVAVFLLGGMGYYIHSLKEKEASYLNRESELASEIAQEESTSISSNIQWSRKKHLEKSQPWEKARYGYISVGKEHIWQVVPREAAIVHRAF